MFFDDCRKLFRGGVDTGGVLGGVEELAEFRDGVFGGDGFCGAGGGEEGGDVEAGEGGGGVAVAFAAAEFGGNWGWGGGC